MQEELIRELLEAAKKIALTAGQHIESRKNEDIGVTKKSNTGSIASEIVTEVDIEVQEMIEKALLPLCQKYDLAFLGEETADNASRFEKEYFWSVDPIDGTLHFTEQIAGYSTSIALVRKDGIPVIGVINDSYNNRLYSAALGLGAFCNDKPIRCQDEGQKGGSSLRCYFDRSTQKGPPYEKLTTGIKALSSRLGYEKAEFPFGGGAALNACWALDNSPSVYFKFPKEKGGSIWDYAATTCLYTELNLPAHDIYGNIYDLNRKESTYMNHRGILFASSETLAKGVMQLYNSLKENKE
eukprot:CAMPEP_0194175318 /NCGR_PEP_ID=MMETSP0154-20130528/9367_1 /TAXON_ID=1049557 /ORGANISM="Thalassiothrix antarctica, Strain L6-D1" /LENGTH=296 /DNA_ID=CAMNT_0038889071 /DNA_START=98 /DNA_END=988 /DNA_ORIENTATION=+